MSGPSEALTEQALRLRRDATIAVLEGFHALKHALRFGAEVELVLAADPDGLDALAQRLAPDVRAQIAAQARPVSEAAVATLSPHALPTGVIAFARRPAHDGPSLRGRSPDGR